MRRTVAYIRVSTDAQETDRQVSAVNAWSRQHSIPIDEFIEDTGRRHEAKHRKGFQDLLRRCHAGEIGLVVIEQQDRLGYADGPEFFHYVHLLRESDTALVAAVDNKVLTNHDMVSMVLGGLGASGSRDELVKASSRRLGKLVEMIRRGEWIGGWIPYATSVVCRSADGAERWRVESVGKHRRLRIFPDGRTEEWNGRGEKCFPQGRMPGDRLVLDRSTRPERLEVLRLAFRLFLADGLAYCNIARRLNRLGPAYRHPHGPWYPGLVRSMLCNPVAIGRPGYNKQANSEYSEFKDGAVRFEPELKKRPNKDGVWKKIHYRKRATQDWVLPDFDVFPPILEDPEDFWRAQELLHRPGGSRTPRSDDLVYAAMVYCGHCNKRMVGWTATKGERGERHSYACATYRRHREHDPELNPTGCRLHRTRQSQIDRAVDAFLERTGRTLQTLTARGESGLVGAMLIELKTGKEARKEELATVWSRMEHYLLETLGEVAHPEPLPDGRTRFELEGPEGPIVVELPGCENREDLEFLYSWVASARRSRAGERAIELEARQRELYQRWVGLDGVPSARDLVKEDMARVDRELAVLRADAGDLGSQVRELYAWLVSQHREIGRVRKASTPRSKARLLHSVLDRIVCYFEHFQAGSQRRSRLVRVDILPIIGEPFQTQVGDGRGLCGGTWGPPS
jgi:DNA invertase Pin-like site-specific DNA recombinase